MSVIEVRGVTKRYGRAPAVSGITVSVEKGQALCLFGPSGCGKTTLLRLIAGLERPDEGAILHDGVVANSPSAFKEPKPGQIGMVFQDLALWPHLRVAGHLDFVLAESRLTRSERRERLRTVLDTCQIGQYAAAYPAELSGGERQRLAIARALVTEQAVLLLDEPLANLDVQLRDTLLVEFRRQKSRGATIVFATHDREEADTLGDYTLPMNAVSSDTPARS